MALRTLRGRTTTNPTNHPFDDLLRNLDAQTGSKVHVTVESRRYGKAVTIIDGLDGRTDIAAILRTLRQRLATGGSSKAGVLELQGDHRRRTTAILASLGIELAP